VNLVRSETAHAQRFVSLGWALLIGSSAFYFLSGNEADNDLWGHVRFGAEIVRHGGVIRLDPFTYTVPGAPWMNHEWLSQVLLYAAYAGGGGPGLWLLKLAVGLATAAFLAGRVRRETASPWIWGPLLLLALAVLSRGFAIRPQIFSYCALAGLLWRLDRGVAPVPSWWALPLLFVLWANLHGAFILGLGALALWGANALAVDRPSRGRVVLVCLLALVATLATPFGWQLLSYIAGELTVEHPITEWQPVSFTDPAHVTYLILVVAFVLTLPFASWRTQGWAVLLALGTAVMAMRHQRHTPVFALIAAGPIAAQLAAGVAWWPWRRVPIGTAAQRAIAVGLVAIALAQVGLLGARLTADRGQIVFDPQDYPVGAVRALAGSVDALNLAVPLDWGEYVIWHLGPRVKVSLDGRFATLFPPHVVRDNFDFFAGAGDWQRLLTAYPTDAVLVPRASPCPIRSQPGWHRAYADPVAEIYLREGHGLSARAVPAPPHAPMVFP
jgi:hypothetical protein